MKQLIKKLWNRSKLFFTRATAENDYLLDYNYKVGPHFNDKNWITGLIAQGVFHDRRTGHVERKTYYIPFPQDEMLFGFGQRDHEFVLEAFHKKAQEKLAATNHLKLARKTINIAIGIQTAIIAVVFGAITTCAIVFL